ncbi:MAG: DUF3830 family protein [Fimbriimonadaceae bacterium]
MTDYVISISETKSGLSATATLFPDKAPENVAFLLRYLETRRTIPSIHAMWTGPEISCPVPVADIEGKCFARALPLENSTISPQPGDIVLSYLPARVWGGGPSPVFDIGLFYGPHGRLFFPVGWLAGSVIGRVETDSIEHLAAACSKIRRSGACDIVFERLEK